MVLDYSCGIKYKNLYTTFESYFVASITLTFAFIALLV